MAFTGVQGDHDYVYVASAKLSGDWSADRFVHLVQPAVLQQLLEHFTELDPMVKTRLILACMLASPKQKADCREQLAALAQAATLDDDEWVKVTGAAVGDFSGQFDLEAVRHVSQVVSGGLLRIQFGAVRVMLGKIA